jgi:hypothetical protein
MHGDLEKTVNLLVEFLSQSPSKEHENVIIIIK